MPRLAHRPYEGYARPNGKKRGEIWKTLFDRVTCGRCPMPRVELPAILVASKGMEEAGHDVNAARPKAGRDV